MHQFLDDQQCGQTASFRAVFAQHQLVQTIQPPRHHFQHFRLVANQALRIQILGQHQIDGMGHVRRREGDGTQNAQAARSETDFFLEFTVGGFQDRFAGINPPLRQTEFVAVRAGGILLDQQHGILVGHGGNHHRAMTLMQGPFITATFAVGKLEINALAPAVAVFNQLAGMDNRQGIHGFIVACFGKAG
jgi:hypothetical protein